MSEWTPILHEIGTVIAAVAACIAATASLRNGRVLNGHLKERDKKRDAKRDKLIMRKGVCPALDKKPDWFSPPDLK